MNANLHARMLDENGHPLDIPALHLSGAEENARWVRRLSLAPENLVQRYLLEVEQNPCEQSITNLHQLIMQSRFQATDAVFDALIRIRSPRTTTFLLELLSRPGLVRRKRILKTLKSIPPREEHPNLILMAEEDEIELSILALELLEILENVTSLDRIRARLGAPWPGTRLAALKVLLRFEGLKPLKQLLASLDSLDDKTLKIFPALSEESPDLQVQQVLIESLPAFPAEIRQKLLVSLKAFLNQENLKFLTPLLHSLAPVREILSLTEWMPEFAMTPISADKWLEISSDHASSEVRQKILELLASHPQDGMGTAAFAWMEKNGDLLNLELPENLNEELKSLLLRHADTLIESQLPLHQMLALQYLKPQENHRNLLHQLIQSRYLKIRALAENHLLTLRKSESSGLKQQIETALENQDPLLASSLAEELLMIEPEKLDIKLLASRAFLQSEQIEKAEKQLKALIKSQPRNFEVLSLIADLEVSQLRFKGARAWLKKAHEVRPDCHKTVLKLIQNAQETQDYAEVLRLGEPRLEEFGSQIGNALIKAAYRLGLMEKIQDFYPRLEAHLGVFGKTYAALGFLRLESGSRAEEIIAGLKADFKATEEHLKAMKALSESTNRRDLEECFLKGMLDLQPESPSAREKLGLFYLKSSPEQTLELIENAPVKSPELRLLQAKARRELGHVETAYSLLEDLFMEDPGFSEATLEMARIRLEKNQFQKALSCLKILEKETFSPLGTHFEFMRCYLGLRDQTEALRHLRLALEEKPVDLKAWRCLVEIARKDLLDATMMSYLEKAPQVLADDPSGLTELFRLCRNEDPDLAAIYGSRLLEVTPEDQEQRLRQALLLTEIGRFGEACSHFEKLKDNLEPRFLMVWAKASENACRFPQTLRLLLNLSKNPEYRRILGEKILHLIRRRESFEAIYREFSISDLKDFEDALGEVPLLPYKFAARAFAQNRLEIAEKAFLLTHNISAGFQRSTFFLGLIAVNFQKFAEASQWLEKSLEFQDSKPCQVRALLAGVQWEQGDFRKSRESWQKVLASSPSRRMEALESLYQIETANQTPLEFLHHLKGLPKELVSRPGISLMAARALLSGKRFEAALKWLSQIPRNSVLFLSRTYLQAQALLALKDGQKALECLNALMDSTEAPKDTRKLMAKAWILKNQHQAALKSLMDYQKLEPCDGEIFWIELKIRSALMQTDFLENVIGKLDPKLALDEDWVELQNSLIQMVAQDLGREALMAIRKFLPQIHEKAPKTPGLHFALLALSGLQAEDEEILMLLEDWPKAPEESLLVLRFDGAQKLQVLKLGVKCQPENTNLCESYAELLASSSNETEALQEFSRLLQLKANQALSSKTWQNSFLLASTLAYRHKNLRLSGEFLNEILKEDPAHTAALKRMSFVMGLLGNHKVRHEFDQRLARLNPSQLDVRARLYQDARREKDDQSALMHLKTLCEARPKDIRLLREFAELSSKNGMHLQALKALENLKNLVDEKESREVALRMGHLWLEVRREFKAVECFEEYLKHAPGNHALRFKVASICRQAGHLDRAILMLREILAEDRHNAAVLLELGEIHLEKGEAETASRLLEESLKIKPWNLNALSSCAKAQLDCNRFRDALKTADKILSQSSNHIGAREIRARIFRNEGMTQEALNELARLQQIQPNPERMVEMAVLNLRMNQKQTALRQLRSVMDQKEANPRIKRLVKSLILKAQAA